MLQRGVMVTLVLMGVALVLLEHAQNPVAQKIRHGLMDAINPILSWVSQPVSSMHQGVARWGDYMNTVEDNRRLAIENERLHRWQAAAEALKAENDSLRALLDYHPAEKTSFVTARVIGQAPGAYSQSLLLNMGATDGLKELQPVVDSYGLIGRVTDVGEHTSRVLLLNDASSRIPVITGDTRQHAILMGTGDEMMRLEHLTAEQQNIAVSEPVVTTAEGNLIPGGLTIGQVFRSDATGYLVKPVRPLTQAEYVRVIVQ